MEIIVDAIACISAEHDVFDAFFSPGCDFAMRQYWSGVGLKVLALGLGQVWVALSPQCDEAQENLFCCSIPCHCVEIW